MLSCTFHCWDWSVDSRSDGTVIQSQPCSIIPQLQQNNCWNESGRFRRVYSRISVSLLQCWSLAFKQTPAQNTVNSGCEHWSEVTTSEKLTDAEPAESRKCVCCVIANKRLYIYAHTVCCASKQWYSVVRKVENVYLGNCSNRDRSCSQTKAVGKAEHKLSTQLLLSSVSMSDCVWSLCRYKYANKLVLFYTQFMTRYILIMHSLQEDVTTLK